MNKTKSFLREVVAKLKGDDAAVLAEKVYRKAISAIKSQIAALQAQEVDEEAALETAEDNLNAAKFPTTLTDNKQYVRNIQTAFEARQKAQDALDATRESIAFFSALPAEYDQEVETV